MASALKMATAVADDWGLSASALDLPQHRHFHFLRGRSPRTCASTRFPLAFVIFGLPRPFDSHELQLLLFLQDYIMNAYCGFLGILFRCPDSPGDTPKKAKAHLASEPAGLIAPRGGFPFRTAHGTELCVMNKWSDWPQSRWEIHSMRSVSRM